MFSFLFGFKGRLGRLGWWSMQLLGTLIYIFAAIIVLMVSDGAPNADEPVGPITTTILSVMILLGFWIATAATIRRYHDRDKSGFWMLISLIPFGALFLIIECGFFAGTDSTNSYGDDHETTSKADLIASVRTGDNGRPDIIAQREYKVGSRQPVKINNSVGKGFGQRTSTPFSQGRLSDL